ncbi:transposase [Marinobacter sp. SS21]|uniref:transposase n=1 Tax=Marinobacter sp. SS21 TaxID=2979460 RepID=UPI003FA5512E
MKCGQTRVLLTGRQGTRLLVTQRLARSGETEPQGDRPPLVGVAPMNCDSGALKGKRRIRSGRHRIRTVMFMAMLSSIQCNPVFKRFHERLKAQGKLAKVALIACMRKLIVVLNTMVKNQEPWREKLA